MSENNQLRISRWYQPDCTLSRMIYKGFQCFGLELPWKGNQPYISCIPEGSYKARSIVSPANGRCIQLNGVPGREFIQIHKGNFTRDVMGCILPGASITYLDADKIPDVTASVATLDRILALIDGEIEVVVYSDKGVYP